MRSTANRIVIIAHYFPPLNSSGAKRMEAMANYWARAGREVVVITTKKTGADGPLTESVPPGIRVIEFNKLGMVDKSSRQAVTAEAADGTRHGRRRPIRNVVMRCFGQIPDPRLPFAFFFLNPFCSHEVRAALREADVIVATYPPWPVLLAAVFANWRWGTPIVLDYRDHLSRCHELPGSELAKALEVEIDRFLNTRAQAVVTVSDAMATYYSDFHPQVFTILNGYDAERVERAKERSPWRPRTPRSPLTVRYLGQVSRGRIPRHLLSAMRELSSKGNLDVGNLRIEYYGNWQLMEQVLIDEYPDLLGFFAFQPPVSYARSLELICSADHLLFCENAIPPNPGQEASAAGILTTKLFEYLASGRPIIADISPYTLAGSFACRASDLHFVSDEIAAFREYLTSEKFWNPTSAPVSLFVETLSRSSQADEYLRRLDAVVAGAAEKPRDGD